MRFYISTAFDNKAQQREVAQALAALGPAWRQTFDWTLCDRTPTPEALTRVTGEEIAGVREADLVVLLLPGGRGTHVEMGVALGLVEADRAWRGSAPRVVVWSWDGSHFGTGSDETCAFYFAPGVERVTGPLSDLVAYLA